MTLTFRHFIDIHPKEKGSKRFPGNDPRDCIQALPFLSNSPKIENYHFHKEKLRDNP